jgi:hypothetical protein
MQGTGDRGQGIPDPVDPVSLPSPPPLARHSLSRWERGQGGEGWIVSVFTRRWYYNGKKR